MKTSVVRLAMTAAACLLPATRGEAASYTSTRSGAWSDLGAATTPWGQGTTTYPGQPQTIVGCSNNGVGGIRVTVAAVPNPATNTGDKMTITGVQGTTEANGVWVVVAVGPTTFDLLGSTFSHLYAAGGLAARGDSVTLGVNNVVTVDVDVTIGSDAPTYVLSVYGSASGLSIAPGNTLTVKGYVLNEGVLTLSAGSVLELGITGARGFWYHHLPSSTIQTTGTGPGSARATIRPWAGSGGWYFLAGGNFHCAYADFLAAGDGNTDAIGVPTGSGVMASFDHCVFDGGGQVNLGVNGDATGTYSLTNCTIKNTANPNYALALNAFVAATTGVRQIVHCYVDNPINFTTGAQNFTITDNVFNGGYQVVGGIATNFGKPTLFARNLLRLSPYGSVAFADMTDCYAIVTATIDNTWFFASPSPYGVTLDGLVFEAPFAALTQPGDCFFMYSGGITQVKHRISRCITLPVAVGSVGNNYASQGLLSGNIQSAQGIQFQQVEIEHNTICMTTLDAVGTLIAQPVSTGPFVNENGTTAVPGSISKLRSNLYWDPRACGNYGCASETVVGAADNLINPTLTGFNGYWQLAKIAVNDPLFPVNYFQGKTNVGTHYATPTTVAVPGGGDVDLLSTPGFYDASRSMLTWFRALNQSQGTRATAASEVDAAFAQCAKLNDDTGFDSRYTVIGLLGWVQGGFTVANPALLGTAHDSTNIGAVQSQIVNITGGPQPPRWIGPRGIGAPTSTRRPLKSPTRSAPPRSNKPASTRER